jgi:opacity protein-like surface antigen
MLRSKLTLLPLAVLSLFLVAESASAQASTTRGFTVGLHFGGTSLRVEGDDIERSSGGGGGIYVGYGVNRRFTIFAQADGARFDEQDTGDIEGEWTLGHFDLGVRFNFANSLRRWVPFLQGALGYRTVTVSDPVVNDNLVSEASFSGAGLTLGGGVDFYLSESWALDLQLLWTGGEFTTVTVDNVSVSGLDVDANSSRINLGVSWWP